MPPNSPFNPWSALGKVLVPVAASVTVPQIRRTGQRFNYPAMGRAWVRGTGPRPLADIDPNVLVETMMTVADLDRIAITHAGALRKASDVFSEYGPPQATVELVRDCFQKLIPHLAEQELDNAGIVARMLGDDRYGRLRTMPSMEERALRGVEGVLSAFSNAITYGRPPWTLFDDDNVHLRDALAEFLRSHAVRNGQEHGTGQEFTRMLDADAILTKPEYADVRVRHQVRLPLADRDLLAAGADDVFYSGLWALIAEYKAYSTYSALLVGELSIRDGVVRGPEILRQVVGRCMRLNRWSWLVPGHDVPMPRGVLLENTDGWRSVPPFFYHVVDDVYLFNNGFAKISEVIRRKGNQPVNIMTDIKAPEPVRRMMVQIYGPVITPDMTARDLWETGLARFATILQQQEVLANARLQRADVVAAVGEVPEIRLVPGSRGIQGLLDRAEADGFVEAIDEVDIP